MKKILTLFLSLILIFNTLYLSAQSFLGDSEIDTEDLNNTINSVNATTNKELNRIIIDEDEEKHNEFMSIYLSIRKEMLKDVKNGTFRQIQNARNKSFAPILDKNARYKDSQYFKKKGEFYKYALKSRYEALEMMEQRPPLGYEDYNNYVKRQVRAMFLQESNEDNIFEQITMDNSRGPINDASYLAGYYAQNYDFYYTADDAVKTLLNDCARLTPQELENDKDCQLANELAGGMDPALFKKATDRVKKIISTAARQTTACLRELMIFQAEGHILFQEAEEYLEFKQQGRNWEACGVTKEEGMNAILSQTLTRAEAEDMLAQEFHDEWIKPLESPKDLKGVLLYGTKLRVQAFKGIMELMNFISPSYWFNRSIRIAEVGGEGLSAREANHEWYVSNLVTLSYNLALAQIATRLITYGKVFYYDEEGFGFERSFCYPEEEGELRKQLKNPEGKPRAPMHTMDDCFAKTWYRYGTGDYFETPIATLLREAVMQSGSQKYQDQRMERTIHALRFNSNLDTYKQIALFGVDMFADPLELVAPAFAAVKAARAANVATKTAKVAKSTQKALMVADNAADVVHLANNTGNLAQAARGVNRADNVMRSVNTVNRATDAGQSFARGVNTAQNATRATGQVARGTEGFNAITDVAAMTTQRPPLALQRTALDPNDMLLTSRFDRTLDLSYTPRQTHRRGIGFKPQDNLLPSSTAYGAPPGMRRQIGFGNEGKYIQETPSLRDPNGPGVQNIADIDYRQMISDDPIGLRIGDTPSNSNPYNVSNSANPNQGGIEIASRNATSPNTPNPQSARPRNASRTVNEWVSPETTVQQTIDIFDDEIAQLQAERKRLGFFSSREKKAKLDREIEALQARRSQFVNDFAGRQLNTHSPIYDNVIMSKKREVESYLSRVRVKEGPASRARDRYVNLYNRYLSVNVDALPPSERLEFLKSFDELSGLRFTDAVSTGPEKMLYQQKFDALNSYINNIGSNGYHIRYGGYGLGQAPGGGAGLREVRFGSINETDTYSMSLNTFKSQIDNLAGPTGFKGPPLVDISAHGYLYEVPQNGAHWHGTFGNASDNTIAEIVNAFDDGHQYSLYIRNCHGSAAMDDFLALPANKRANINLFTEAGRNQGNFALTGKLPGNSSNAWEAAIDNMVSSLQRGNIGSRAFVNGTHYYPLEEAIKQARREGNLALANKLDVYRTLLETNVAAEFERAAAQYSRLFPGTPAPKKGPIGFSITRDPKTIIPGKTLYVDPESVNYVKQVGNTMMSPLRIRTDINIPQKLNPATLTVPTINVPASGGKPTRISI